MVSNVLFALLSAKSVLQTINKHCSVSLTGNVNIDLVAVKKL